MAKVLITGGAGYLGSMLTGALLFNHEVTVFDNFMYRQASLNPYCLFPTFKVINGDVTNWEVLGPLVRQADIIIPLAALVGAPLCERNPSLAWEVNYKHVRNIVATSRSEKTLKKIIIPITNSGYGVGEPGKECTEATPMRPISVYGKTKVRAENEALEHYPEGTVSLRLATVFGMSPRMRLDLLVNEFVYRAVNDRCITLFESHFKRNYIHIRDVCNAFYFAIENFDKMAGKPYNVGLSDANLSKKELCERIQLQLPKFTFNEAKIGEDPDKRDYIVSNARIEALGFKPEHSLDVGIRELVKGFQYIKNNQHGNV